MSADSPRRSSGGTSRGMVAVPSIVPPQIVSDRSILDSAIGFINEVTLAHQPLTDPKDTITWARFETAADISDPRFGEDWELEGNVAPPLLLILGYGLGVQVWAIPANGEAVEVLSWRHGIVTALRVLPTPSSSTAIEQNGRADEPIDAFAEKRPLIALVDGSSSSGAQPQFCAVNFISLKTGTQVKTIKFKNPVIDILANRSSIVITLHERIFVFDARTLEDRVTITTNYPSPGINPNPVALGPRWLAYGEHKLLHSKRSGGGCDGEGVASYTATVLNASKSLVKGLRELGEQVAAGLTGTSGSGGSSKNVSFESAQGPDAKQPGIVTVIDIKNSIRDYSPTTGVAMSSNQTAGTDPIIAHFIAHSEALVAMEFDNSGMLLVTADRRGHDFHVFRIQPNPVGSSLAAVHHLYVLHRGDTSAKVQNISFSLDSRWVAVSTLRGTTHVFPITPYGGPMCVRTHTSLHVVNKLSRFHRSAGLSADGRSNSPITHSESTTFSQSLQPYHNPTLPPFSRPIVVVPLAQLRQPFALGTPPGSANLTGAKSASGVSASGGSQRQRLSSLSDDNGKPLSVCAIFAKSRSWLLDPPNVTREAPHRMQRKAVDSLFVMAGHGALIQYDLDTRLASNVAKEKICDDTPIELEVEAKAQWNLGRRKEGSQEIMPPLTLDNWLIKNRNSCMLTDSTRQYDDSDDKGESWLAQVEIVTHAGPHRRLWMGPQFVFKTYNTPSGSNLSHVDVEAVEIGTNKSTAAATGSSNNSSSSTVAKTEQTSSPLNMPMTAAGRSSAVPVLIESGSYSSIEQSPKLMDRFRHDHLDSDYAVTHGDSRLKEDLADAMRESPSVSALTRELGRAALKSTNSADNIAFYDALTEHDEDQDQDYTQQYRTASAAALASALPNIHSYDTSSSYESMDSMKRSKPSIEKIVNPLGTVTTVNACLTADVQTDILDEVVSQLAAEDTVIHENCDESLFRPVVAIFCDEKTRKLGEEEARKQKEHCQPPEVIKNKLIVPVIAKEIDDEINKKEKQQRSAKSPINQASRQEINVAGLTAKEQSKFDELSSLNRRTKQQQPKSRSEEMPAATKKECDSEENECKTEAKETSDKAAKAGTKQRQESAVKAPETDTKKLGEILKVKQNTLPKNKKQTEDDKKEVIKLKSDKETMEKKFAITEQEKGKRKSAEKELSSKPQNTKPKETSPKPQSKPKDDIVKTQTKLKQKSCDRQVEDEEKPIDATTEKPAKSEEKSTISKAVTKKEFRKHQQQSSKVNEPSSNPVEWQKQEKETEKQTIGKPKTIDGEEKKNTKESETSKDELKNQKIESKEKKMEEKPLKNTQISETKDDKENKPTKKEEPIELLAKSTAISAKKKETPTETAIEMTKGKTEKETAVKFSAIERTAKKEKMAESTQAQENPQKEQQPERKQSIKTGKLNVKDLADSLIELQNQENEEQQPTDEDHDKKKNVQSTTQNQESNQEDTEAKVETPPLESIEIFTAPPAPKPATISKKNKKRGNKSSSSSETEELVEIVKADGKACVKGKSKETNDEIVMIRKKSSTTSEDSLTDLADSLLEKKSTMEDSMFVSFSQTTDNYDQAEELAEKKTKETSLEYDDKQKDIKSKKSLDEGNSVRYTESYKTKSNNVVPIRKDKSLEKQTTKDFTKAEDRTSTKDKRRDNANQADDVNKTKQLEIFESSYETQEDSTNKFEEKSSTPSGFEAQSSKQLSTATEAEDIAKKLVLKVSETEDKSKKPLAEVKSIKPKFKSTDSEENNNTQKLDESIDVEDKSSKPLVNSSDCEKKSFKAVEKSSKAEEKSFKAEEKSSCMAEEESSKAENTSSKVEDKPSKAEEKSSKQLFKSSKAGEKSSTSKEKTSKEEDKSSKKEDKPSNAEDKSSKAEEKSSKAEEKSSKAEEKTSKAEEKSSKAEEKSSKAEEKSSKAEEKSSKPEEKSSKPDLNSYKAKEKSSKPDLNSSKAEEKPSNRNQDSSFDEAKENSGKSIDFQKSNTDSKEKLKKSDKPLSDNLNNEKKSKSLPRKSDSDSEAKAEESKTSQKEQKNFAKVAAAAAAEEKESENLGELTAENKNLEAKNIETDNINQKLREAEVKKLPEKLKEDATKKETKAWKTLEKPEELEKFQKLDAVITTAKKSSKEDVEIKTTKKLKNTQSEANIEDISKTVHEQSESSQTKSKTGQQADGKVEANQTNAAREASKQNQTLTTNTTSPKKKTNDTNEKENKLEKDKTSDEKPQDEPDKASEHDLEEKKQKAHVETSKKTTEESMKKSSNTAAAAPTSIAALPPTTCAWKTLSGADLINKTLKQQSSKLDDSKYPSLGAISKFSGGKSAKAEKLLPELPTPKEFKEPSAILKKLPKKTATAFDDFPTLKPLEALPPLPSLEPLEFVVTTSSETKQASFKEISLINFESPLQENPAIEKRITPAPRGFTEQNLIFALCGSLHYENEQQIICNRSPDKMDISPTLSSNRSSSAMDDPSMADYKSLTENDDPYISLEQSSQDTNTTNTNTTNDKFSSSTNSSGSEEIIIMEEKKMTKKQKRKRQQQLLELQKQKQLQQQERQQDVDDEELRPLITMSESQTTISPSSDIQTASNAAAAGIIAVSMDDSYSMKPLISTQNMTQSTTTDSEGPMPATTSDDNVFTISTSLVHNPHKIKTKKLEHKINLIAAIEAATSSSTSSAEESGVELGGSEVIGTAAGRRTSFLNNDNDMESLISIINSGAIVGSCGGAGLTTNLPALSLPIIVTPTTTGHQLLSQSSATSAAGALKKKTKRHNKHANEQNIDSVDGGRSGTAGCKSGQINNKLKQKQINQYKLKKQATEKLSDSNSTTANNLETHNSINHLKQQQQNNSLQYITCNAIDNCFGPVATTTTTTAADDSSSTIVNIDIFDDQLSTSSLSNASRFSCEAAPLTTTTPPISLNGVIDTNLMHFSSHTTAAASAAGTAAAEKKLLKNKNLQNNEIRKNSTTASSSENHSLRNGDKHRGGHHADADDVDDDDDDLDDFDSSDNGSAGSL